MTFPSQPSLEIWLSRAVFHLLEADLWISSHPGSSRTQLLPFHPEGSRPPLLPDLRSWNNFRTFTERLFLLSSPLCCCCPSPDCSRPILQRKHGSPSGFMKQEPETSLMEGMILIISGFYPKCHVCRVMISCMKKVSAWVVCSKIQSK